MKIGDSVVLDVNKLNEDAKGVCFLGKRKITITDVIDGEKVQMGIVAIHGDGAIGRIENIVKPSVFRVVPKCPYTKACGGCDLQHMTYEKQLALKKEIVISALSDFKGVGVNNTIGAFYPYAYRNKVHFAIGKSNGKTKIGFYEEGCKEMLDIPICVLHDQWYQKLYNILHSYIKQIKIEPYDTQEQTGLLRYVTARCIENNIIVTAVVAKKLLPKSEMLYQLLKQNFKQVSLYINVNNRTDSLVYSNAFTHMHGEKTLKTNILGVEVELFPTSFLQVNLPIASKIYQKAIELAGITEQSEIIDLFSGIGITSLLFAKLGATVTSIELEKSAVSEAKRLIKANGLEQKITALQGNCNEILKQVIEELSSKNQKTIFVDPPRKGLETSASVIAKSNAEKIIYLSCNPQSLTQDLKILTSNYKIVSVTPYDMFPQTKHVETLVFLTKK